MRAFFTKKKQQSKSRKEEVDQPMPSQKTSEVPEIVRRKSTIPSSKEKHAHFNKRKKRLAAQAEAQKYASPTKSDELNSNSQQSFNYQDAPTRRYRKMQEETGIFDIHGRRVCPKVIVSLENFSPRISKEALPSQTKTTSQMSKDRKSSTTRRRRQRQNSLVDNIKGALSRDYRRPSNKLMIDDRRCYKYIRMLKSGTPRATVEKLMMKTLGDEGFSSQLLDNWQNKIIYANQIVKRKKRQRRTSNAQFVERFQLGKNVRGPTLSSVDQHELDMISRNNNEIKLVVTYIIYLMQQQEGKARDLFARVDTSGDGQLSEEEFKKGLIQLGFSLAEEETKLLFKAIDDDGSGEIEIREFVRLLHQPLDPVHVSVIELLGSLRRLEVIVSQEHVTFIHEYLVNDMGAIDASELHELIMNPTALERLNPHPENSLHPKDPSGRPKHKTYRFTNPLLSTATLDAEEIQKARDRILLHKTVKRLENAYVASAFVIWRAKMIADLHLNLKKKNTSSKLKMGKKNQRVDVREERRRKAQSKMNNEDLSDQHYDGALAKTTIMSAKIAVAKMKREKEEKKRKAVEKIKKEMADPDGTPRPAWGTSMMFPHRYRHLKEIPPLGKMFKNTAFWRPECNPKTPATGLPQKPTESRRNNGRGNRRNFRGRKVSEVSLDDVTNINSFTKHAASISSEFRSFIQQPGISAPTPDEGGFYIPPSPRTNFPMLERFFKGGKAKELIRAFQKYEAPIPKSK